MKKENNYYYYENKTIEFMKIKRTILFKLLYKSVDNIKDLTIEIVNKVKKRYPFFKEIVYILDSFKKILKNKQVNKLNDWILNAKKLKNKFINSFINGITRDLDAVKNAIIYNYNNGLAEGCVNKLKLIKRIMYGRNSFDMLRKKVLFIENNKLSN